jgi:ATP-dependent Clp protease ATP-binding subunit ClpB
MQKEIDDKLARALLSGEIRDGDSVMVDLAPDGETLLVSRADVATDEGRDDSDEVIDAELLDE